MFQIVRYVTGGPEQVVTTKPTRGPALLALRNEADRLRQNGFARKVETSTDTRFDLRDPKTRQTIHVELRP